MSAVEDLRDLEPTAVVATSNGPIRGYRANGLEIFKGVRYAAPPVGKLRFQPPRRPAPWTEAVDTVSLGAPAIQVGVEPGETTGGRSAGDPPAPGQPGTDEDCLFINVWTPGLSGKRPVMVWLHGGGFANGSGGAAMYDGEALARRGDVVMVTVNHRLNVFGYLHLGEFGGHPSSGEAGMLDIVLALEWVRDNIAKLRRRSGQRHHLRRERRRREGRHPAGHAAPRRGLFHRAIIQSGPGLKAVSRESATKYARALPGSAGHQARRTRQAGGGLRRRNPGRGGQGRAAQRHRRLQPLRGRRRAAARSVHPDAPAVSKDVPVMIGTNKDEATLFLFADPRFGEYTDEDLAKRAQRVAGDRAAALIAAARETFPDYSPSHLLSMVQTITMFWRDSIATAERKAAQGGAPAFMYLLEWETTAARGKLRSPHALEIPLVFDNVGKAVSFMGRSDPQALAEQMSEAWLAFARTGNPSTPVLPNWPAYEPGRRSTMVFNSISRVVEDPYPKLRAAAQDQLPFSPRGEKDELLVQRQQGERRQPVFAHVVLGQVRQGGLEMASGRVLEARPQR